MLEKQALLSSEVSSKDTVSLPIYENTLRQLATMQERALKGRRVIKVKDIPWDLNRNGIVRWYTEDQITDTALNTWTLFVHEVRTHGGKHVHQGGLCLFILKGKGYTVVDGIRNDWQEGDLILLPVKKGGVEHQHFNLEDKPSRFLALINLPILNLAGHFMQQRENHPMWKAQAKT